MAFDISQIQIGSNIFNIKDSTAARVSDIQRIIDLLESGTLVAYPIVWNLGSKYSLSPGQRLTGLYFASESDLEFNLSNPTMSQSPYDLIIKRNGVDITEFMADNGYITDDQDTLTTTLLLESPGSYEIIEK